MLDPESVLCFARDHRRDDPAPRAAAVQAVKGNCDVPTGEERRTKNATLAVPH